MKILLEAAINPQKKNTSTRVLNAPVLVGCLVWLIKFVSLIVYRLCKILKIIIECSLLGKSIIKYFIDI